MVTFWLRIRFRYHLPHCFNPQVHEPYKTSKWSTNRQNFTELRFLLGIIPYLYGVLHLILEQTSRETTSKERITTRMTHDHACLMSIPVCISNSQNEFGLCMDCEPDKVPKSFLLARNVVKSCQADQANLSADCPVHYPQFWSIV